MLYRFNLMKLYAYQERARDYLIEKKRALLAFSMGLGKTFIALAAAERLNLPTVIICPAFMKYTWADALKLFNIHDVRIETWSNIKMNSIPSVLIADESHYAKGPTAQRTIAFMQLAECVREKKNGYVWLLSGTPAKNSAAELYCQFKSIGMTKYHSYAEFADDFSLEYMVKYGNMRKEEKKYRGVKNIEKLRELYKDFMWVMRTEEAVELPNQIKKKILNDFSVFNEEDLSLYRSDVDSFMKKNFSTKKQQQALMNVKQTRALAQDLEDTFEKIVIFSDHVSPAVELARDLKCDVISGDVAMDKRHDIIERFKLSGRHLCCTIGAAGVGLNLQFANCMIFNDLPWDAASLLQAEKRIHRIGQSEHCHYFYIIDPGMGEVIYRVLERKIADLEQIR